MATLFFSYSHRDEKLRDQLEVHLATLKREGLITTWHDREIPAGDEFDKAIAEEMEKADVILLLVSSNFLASPYCYDVELARAIERHDRGLTRVIPVILRPCDWKSTPFAKLRAAPKDGKAVTKWPHRDEAFLDVVQHIRDALTKLAPSELAPTKKREKELNVQGTASRGSGIGEIVAVSDIKRDRAFDRQLAWYEKMIAALHHLAERIEIASTFQEDNKSSHELLAEQWEKVQIAHIQLEESANMAGLYGSAEAVRNCARISKVVQKVAEETEAFDLANHPEAVAKLELIDALPPKLREAAKPLAKDVRRLLGIS
jgi:TIR domain